MRSSAILFEIIEPFARYVCAIFVTIAVAAVISLGAVTVFGYGLMALLSGVVFVGLPSAAIAFCAAFTAIYSGSLCLARTNRIIVSIMLTVLGTVTYQIFWYSDWQYRIHFYKHGRGSLAPLIALGGVSVCILNSLISRRRLKGKPVVHSPVVKRIEPFSFGCYQSPMNSELAVKIMLSPRRHQPQSCGITDAGR